jgi:hypothetical protein
MGFGEYTSGCTPPPHAAPCGGIVAGWLAIGSLCVLPFTSALPLSLSLCRVCVFPFVSGQHQVRHVPLSPGASLSRCLLGAELRASGPSRDLRRGGGNWRGVGTSGSTSTTRCTAKVRNDPPPPASSLVNAATPSFFFAHPGRLQLTTVLMCVRACVQGPTCSVTERATLDSSPTTTLMVPSSLPPSNAGRRLTEWPSSCFLDPASSFLDPLPTRCRVVVLSGRWSCCRVVACTYVRVCVRRGT